jgi:hypothetical protein
MKRVKLMLEEKLELFKDRGWTYNPETGDIFSHTGRLIKGKDNKGYVKCGLRLPDGVIINVRAHQLGYYMMTGLVGEIDHINRIKDDNRLSNIRLCNSQINNSNKNVNGFCYMKRLNKFQSYIYKNKKKIYLGLYENELEAKKAYLDAKKIYHNYE